MLRITHNSKREWECPICKVKNNKYISTASIVTCCDCHTNLSLKGEEVVRFKERFM